MEILNKDYYDSNRPKVNDLLKKAVFIYPTDTIYGIGCDARNEKLVDRIRKMKKTGNPFSIIIPHKKWIRENCAVGKKAVEWLGRLPGPYTLIFRLKKKNVVAGNVSYADTIAVRIPDNWFSQVVKELGFPIISTSANFHGQNYMMTLDDLPHEIRQEVDYIFYDGELKGHPSTIIHLEGDEVKVVER